MANDKLAHIAAYLPRKDGIQLTDVDRFGNESRRTQLEVLSELRRRAANDRGATAVSVVALFLTVVALTGLSIRVGWQEDALTNILLLGVLLLIVLAVIVPVVVRIAWVQRERGLAIVWLRAYEDEIRRRRFMRGAAGREWRATH